MILPNFLPPVVSPSFLPFLEEQAPLLQSIFYSIAPPFNPAPPFVLRFLAQDVSSLKVVILGQDPYPDASAATGRAFEPGNLSSWLDPFRQVSLKNIMRSLYALHTGQSPYTPFSTIKEEISQNTFCPPSPKDLFDSWESQGVLLLNTYLTCQTGKSGSHKALWLPFAKNLISFLDEANPSLSWFLWGKEAISFAPYIQNGTIFPSRHPMMCSASFADDFLKNPCFQETSHEISWI